MNAMCLDHPKTTLLPPESMGKSPSTRLVPGAKKAGECVCAQLCPTLCNSKDCSPPGSSVHGISQARKLE